MITGISGLGFSFVRKWPFRDAHLFFKKCSAETLSYSVFRCAFLAKLSKKGNFGHPPKNWLIAEKLFGEYFLCFFVLFFFILLFFFCVFEGSGEVARRATSLEHKPYLLYFFCSGPPHLALNPPYRFFSLLLIEKTVVPLNKGIFVYWKYFPLFVLSPFWPPTCWFLFVSLLFFFFLFFFCFFFFFLFFVCLSWTEQHPNIQLQNAFASIPFFFGGGGFLFLFPFFIFVFSWF